jgi:hypothetical protein
MDWPTIIVVLVVVAFVLWLVTDGLWRVLRLIGRRTGLDEKVDRALDAEGELDASDYLKFKEQHRGAGRRGGIGGGGSGF